MNDIKIILTRIAALPFALYICACSCVLSCMFLLSGTPAPALTGAWWTNGAVILYLSKVGIGISVSVAQLFCLVVHQQSGDRWMLRLYWIATCISVFISVLSLQLMIQQGASNARYGTKEFEGFEAEETRIIKTVEDLRAEKEETVSRLMGVNKVTRANDAALEYEEMISAYESKLYGVQAQKNEYIGDSNKTEEAATSSSTYAGFSNDIQQFFGLPQWVGGKLVVAITYGLLFFVSALMDLIGSMLLRYAVCGVMMRPEAQQIERTGERPRNTMADLATMVFGGIGEAVGGRCSKAWQAWQTAGQVGERIHDGGNTSPIGGTDLHHQPIKTDAGGPGDYSRFDDTEAHCTYTPPPSDFEDRIVRAYQDDGSYNSVFRQTGIPKSAESLVMIKGVLDKFGVPHNGNGRG